MYRTIQDLQSDIERFNVDLHISENTSVLFQSISISTKNDKLIVPNRLAIHPMEGFDANLVGDPTRFTQERYARYGSSGAGIIWFEATAVIDEGRSNPHQLMITEHNISKFKELVDLVHQQRKQLLKINEDLSPQCFQNPINILQLTHSGRYSQPRKERHPFRITNIPELDTAMHIPTESGEIVSDAYLDSLQDRYLDAIACAYHAGFDGIDIKSCHGYLISELLGSYTRTESQYGGEMLSSRGKFLMDIVKKTRREYPELLVTIRLNLFDALAYPFGISTRKVDEQGIPILIDLSEIHQMLDQLSSYGLQLVNFTAGNPYYKPFLSRPYVQNSFNGPEAPEHPLKSIGRIHLFLREISRLHPQLITLGTALSWFRQFGSYIAAGEIQQKTYDIAGFGRLAFADPQFVLEIYRTGRIDPRSTCITCSKCTELMRMGSMTGCVMRNPQYASIYRNVSREYRDK